MTPAQLDRAFHAASPRHGISCTSFPWPAALIHGGVIVLFVLLAIRAFSLDNAFAWSVGIAYVLYDTLLILLVFATTLPLARPEATSSALCETKPTLGIIVASHNEASVLPLTLNALFASGDPPDLVLVADDGSSDDTRTLMMRAFGLDEPPVGGVSAPSRTHPTLRWLRLPHGGKARALNAALLAATTDVVVTVDADTLLDPAAVGAVRRAFARDRTLVAATGVLNPACGHSLSGRLLENFQTYEYIRNFLSRYAWARMDALLLISGAFAAYRREAVTAVGGLDPACMVEDYELIHRLHRWSTDNRLGWTTGVIGGARAITDAPATIPAFLRQRRRWFCGFLQTQWLYRDMVGSARYGRLGLVMLPIKALDTLQPIYGLFAFGLLAAFAISGRTALLLPAGGVVAAKIVLDYAFHLWSVRLYRNWVDPESTARLHRAFLTSLVEPFTFQILRHTGAALGWMSFLGRRRAWGRQSRMGLLALGTTENPFPITHYTDASNHPTSG